MGTKTIFGRDELELIALAGCTLDEKPGSNWVQEGGGLPEYICRIARAIKRSGKTTSQAIAIAVSRVKKWAAGGDDVDADTRAKAAKALAQWEALKVKAKGKKAVKKAASKAGDDKVAASRVDDDLVLCLANVDYNVDLIRRAFESNTRRVRSEWRTANPNADYDSGPPYWYIKEQWTSHLIVAKDYDSPVLYKIPFTVDEKLAVDFADPVEVKTEYVVVDSSDIADDYTDADLQKLLAASAHDDSCAPTALDRIVALTATTVDPLDKILAAHRARS